MNRLLKSFNTRKSNYKIHIIILSLLISLTLIGCEMIVPTSGDLPDDNVVVNVDGQLTVHFIDVGQADAILIQNKNQAMLIDAGNNGDGDLVTEYIKDLGINKLDYVIGTHPHEDHIGGLDIVIASLEIGEVILPKVTSNTKTFEDVLNSIKNKGLSITEAVVGSTFNLGDAKNLIIGPNGNDYSDKNDSSIVIKLTFGKNSFIFTGDAEEKSEHEIIEKGFDLSADVLKLGHHGSHSSTSIEFLEKVNPSIAIAMCGVDNKYGHPHIETLDKLKSKGIQFYRTDELGTIIITSDGNTIKVNGKEETIVNEKKEDDSSNSDNSNSNSENTNGLTIENFTDVVNRGDNATVTIKGNPDEEYDITVYYSSGASSSKDLERKISDNNGNITWTWKVSSNTKPGVYKIKIEGYGETLEKQFEVK